ncbi:MAG: hypothetical protein ACREBT_01110 [Thermoplasmata archaeon]
MRRSRVDREPAFRFEAEMVAPMRAHLEREHYRVYVNPDGRDYFDMIARRGSELGLVELKRTLGAKVFGQALRRRAWGDWVAVALGSEMAARRLVAERTGRLSAAVGVYWVHGSTVDCLRPSRAVPAMAAVDGRPSARTELAGWLDAVDRGELPREVHWDGLFHDLRRLSGGRRYREWTLEEAGDGRT